MTPNPGRTPDVQLVATVQDKPLFLRLIELLAERAVCTLKTDDREENRLACLDRIEELERDCLELLGRMFPSTPLRNLTPSEVDGIWLQAHSENVRVGLTYSSADNPRRMAWVVLKPELYYQA